MVNLIAERDVVPELVQDGFTPERVRAELQSLLSDGSARAAMIEGFEDVRRRLHASNAEGSASERAARAVLTVVGQAS
jgi:lipid-A-disaccharide synthase